MRILVTGGYGMLASSIKKVFEQTSHTMYFLGSRDMDVANFSGCKATFDEIRPDIVFHLAAKTDLDKCEVEVDETYRTNVIGTWNVASLCKEFGSTLFYISTDGVFDGRKGSYYTEYDLPNPITVYGRTKYEGEKIVSNLLDKYFILRAGWMFGGAEKDFKFVGKILAVAKEQSKLSVVSDKIGSPIYTKDLATFMRDLINDTRYGIYHVCNEGMCSRYEFALKILEYAGIRSVRVAAIDSSTFKTVASRPAMTPIRNYNIVLQGRHNLRKWEDALKEYIEDYFV